jgi:hypothetical protein
VERMSNFGGPNMARLIHVRPLATILEAVANIIMLENEKKSFIFQGVVVKYIRNSLVSFVS